MASISKVTYAGDTITGVSSKYTLILMHSTKNKSILSNYFIFTFINSIHIGNCWHKIFVYVDSIELINSVYITFIYDLN